mgnify:CR=1 FL=1
MNDTLEPRLVAYTPEANKAQQRNSPSHRESMKYEVRGKND